MSTGGRWSLGAKPFVAPSHDEQRRDSRERFAIETERRRLDEIKHEEKRLRESNRLDREAARVNDRYSSTAGYGLATALPYVRGRSRSFGGIGSGSPYSYGGVGTSAGRVAETLGGGLIGRERDLERRRREIEAENLEARRRALEYETARRRGSPSMLGRNPQLFPGYSPRFIGGRTSPHFHQQSYGNSLDIPGVGGYGGLRRTRSFGSVPHRHYQAQPLSARYGLTPTVGGYSPRIGGYSRGYSPGRAGGGLSHPHHHATSSPRVVNNYNIRNVSPGRQHFNGDGRDYQGFRYPVAGYSPGQGRYLGDYNDADGGIDQGLYPNADLRYGSGGGQVIDDREQGFVVTDLDYDENGRQIISELEYVEGSSFYVPSAGGIQALTEDEKLESAIEDLTRNAQMMGANAVLGVEVGEDVAGMEEVVVRGRAVILG